MNHSSVKISKERKISDRSYGVKNNFEINDTLMSYMSINICVFIYPSNAC